MNYETFSIEDLPDDLAPEWHNPIRTGIYPVVVKNVEVSRFGKTHPTTPDRPYLSIRTEITEGEYEGRRIAFKPSWEIYRKPNGRLDTQSYLFKQLTGLFNFKGEPDESGIEELLEALQDQQFSVSGSEFYKVTPDDVYGGHNGSSTFNGEVWRFLDVDADEEREHYKSKGYLPGFFVSRILPHDLISIWAEGCTGAPSPMPLSQDR